MRWQNMFTGEALSVSERGAERGIFLHEVFRRLPVALLMGATLPRH